MRFLLLTCTLAITAHAQQPLSVVSPDGKLALTFSTQGRAPGKLVYSVTFQGKPAVSNSALALSLDQGGPLGAAVAITGSEPSQGSDDYTLQFQKTSRVHDRYNALTLHTADAGGRKLDIEARAYDGGVAFRYVVPAQPQLASLHLKQENTEFRLPQDAIDWLLALPSYRSSYESEYVNLPTTALSNQGGVSSNFLIGLPMLLREPGTAWLAIMEAGIEGSSSLYLTNPSGNWAGHYFISRLSPSVDHPAIAVEAPLPYRSAWRLLLVADNPQRFIESTLQYSLNAPARLADTSWIHPGKASWNWWVDSVDADGHNAFTTDNMKRYVDFASQSGLEYFLLDAGWADHGDLTRLNGKVDIPELVRYARAKHVGVWIWCGADAVARQMQDAFPLFEQWGVAGVKIDFVNRDDQTGVAWYYETAREAAAHHLMVDFHGTRTPWGIERTYPNVLSYEAVLGAENDKVGRRDSPVDRTVFPFTRLLAGPMDYTPGGFRDTTEDAFVAQNTNPMVMGTRAQQLALYVVYQTPIQMVSDSPEAYRDQPAFQFIRDVPAAWDSTHVLNGAPGEFVTIARQHGRDWYLGSMTNWTARTLAVPLSFLPTGAFTAEIYEDASDAATQPTHVTVRKQRVRNTQTLTLRLAPGGGAAIRFRPE